MNACIVCVMTSLWITPLQTEIGVQKTNIDTAAQRASEHPPQEMSLEWKCLDNLDDIGEPTDFRVNNLDGRWSVIVSGTDGAAEVTPNGCHHIIFDHAVGDDIGRTKVVNIGGGEKPEYLQGGWIMGGKQVRLLDWEGHTKWKTSIAFDRKAFGGLSAVIPIQSCAGLDGHLSILCVGLWEKEAILLDDKGQIRKRIPWDRQNDPPKSIDVSPIGYVVYGTGHDLVARDCNGSVLWRTTIPKSDRWISSVRYSAYYSAKASKSAFAVNNMWCLVDEQANQAEWQPMSSETPPGLVPFVNSLNVRIGDKVGFLKLLLPDPSSVEPQIAVLDETGTVMHATNPKEMAACIKAFAWQSSSLMDFRRCGDEYLLFLVQSRRLWMGKSQQMKTVP